MSIRLVVLFLIFNLGVCNAAQPLSQQVRSLSADCLDWERRYAELVKALGTTNAELQKVSPLLLEIEQKLDDVTECNRAQSDEVLRLKAQLEDARSFEGWLTHKKGAGIWFCLAVCGAAYKKGLFDWVPRYEKKLVQALRARNNKMRRWILMYVSSKKASRL